MGLVAHHEVPLGITGPELQLELFVAGELVQARDDQVVLLEPVAARRFQTLIREDGEPQVEALLQFVLPLFGERPGADDETALQIAAGDQLPDEQTRHDRLAGARVVGEKEAEWLARQHLLVNGGDLVGQRLDVGGVNGEQRVEQVGEADALRFGRQPEQGAIAVEGPGSAG